MWPNPWLQPRLGRDRLLEGAERSPHVEMEDLTIENERWHREHACRLGSCNLALLLTEMHGRDRILVAIDGRDQLLFCRDADWATCVIEYGGSGHG
jgi:hypothetical protein